MKKINIIIRICILVSPFLFPWWVPLVFGLAALFSYENYYEIIILGLLSDILYNSNNSFFGLYGFTLISCLLFVIVAQIKQRLIVY